MSNVNRGWMSRRMKSDRITLTDEYKNDVEEFLDSAKRFGLTKDKTLCPCKNCGNGHWENLDTIKFHLYASGFFESYTVWTLHGEKEPTTESRRICHRKRRAPPIVEPPVDMFGLLRDSSGQDFYSFNDMRGSNSSSMNDAEESPNFDASQFYTDANESGAPIYLGNKNYTKLSFTTRLLHFKDVSRCSEKSFNLLLDIIGEVLPRDHKLSVSYYAMKKMVKKLKLGYEKIDVCANNCMLFYNNDEKKVVCDICKEDRYKDIMGKNGRKIPKKVLRHFPLIPRLQRLYMSEHTAKHMTWHKNREIKEGELSHPSDGDDWKNFDKRYPSFAKEFRNVRLGLSSNGFNPFGNSGNNVYTLWPVVVVVYNLPPSMCMKRPFMFMTLLIPGPDNLKKNLNVFLRPLMNELFILWQSGVETYDQHLKTNFIMKAALMWTISDFPALGMLSGWSTKGKMGCPVCVGNVQGFQLKNYGKCCFYGTYRTFLDKNDPMRKKNQKYATTELKVFDGRTKGEKLLSSLLQIDFAPPGNTFSKFKPRGYGVDHHWTHFSMFWELPYWASHDLRHCIDVMHTEKNVFENIFYTIVNDRIKTKDKKKSRADCKYLDV
ncbi:uncharacterized protein LOC141691115 [Apium graveolens]|uniref:uncharacterized protein LOC141691115 n=1 Tax=Apium graveolens TaxID=4045 RepID=UPI003D797F50